MPDSTSNREKNVIAKVIMTAGDDLTIRNGKGQDTETARAYKHGYCRNGNGVDMVDRIVSRPSSQIQNIFPAPGEFGSESDAGGMCKEDCESSFNAAFAPVLL